MVLPPQNAMEERENEWASNSLEEAVRTSRGKEKPTKKSGPHRRSTSWHTSDEGPPEGCMHRKDA